MSDSDHDAAQALARAMQRRDPLAPDLAALRQSEAPATAPSSPADPRKWSTTDKALMGLFTALVITDLAQTGTSAANDWRDERGWERHEQNPLLGRKPSPAKVWLGGGAAALGTGLAAHYLPPNWRKALLLAGIGAEGITVAANHNNGMRINLRRMF